MNLKIRIDFGNAFLTMTACFFCGKVLTGKHQINQTKSFVPQPIALTFRVNISNGKTLHGA